MTRRLWNATGSRTPDLHAILHVEGDEIYVVHTAIGHVLSKFPCLDTRFRYQILASFLMREGLQIRYHLQ